MAAAKIRVSKLGVGGGAAPPSPPKSAPDQVACAFFFIFYKVFGGHMSFFGATGTPVLDFW